MIAIGADDAEETVSSGAMNLTSSDIDLITNGGTQLIAGMRFQAVSILRAATIHRAYLQFQADENDSGPAVLMIEAEASDDSPPLLASAGNLSGRPPTRAWAGWSTPTWSLGQ